MPTSQSQDWETICCWWHLISSMSLWEISLWCCFYGEVDKGSCLLAGKLPCCMAEKDLTLLYRRLGWGWLPLLPKAVGKLPFHPNMKEIQIQRPQKAGKDNHCSSAPPEPLDVARGVCGFLASSYTWRIHFPVNDWTINRGIKRSEFRLGLISIVLIRSPFCWGQ